MQPQHIVGNEKVKWSKPFKWQKGYSRAAGFDYYDDGRFNVNGNNNLNNNGRSRGIAYYNTGTPCFQNLNEWFVVKTYKNLYSKLCSLENLKLAWRKARKRKTLKPDVINFENNLKENLLQLRSDLF